jgi:ABC-2 type transport system permease protein
MYTAFALSAFQTRMVYRGQVWAQLLGEMVRVFAKIAIWTAVFGAVASVDGVTLSDMTTYAVLAGAVMAWEWERLLNTIGTQIKTGDVAVFLLKPLSYPLMLFASECGNFAFKMISVVLPVAVVAGLFYGLSPPASLAHGLMFIGFWAVAFAILFLCAALGGLVAFWLMTAFTLEWLLSAVLSILSGSFIPLWFFPEPIEAVIRYLPFAWIGFHPLSVYLGKVSVAEAGMLLAIGAGWAIVLGVAVALLWRRAALRIVVQGG